MTGTKFIRRSSRVAEGKVMGSGRLENCGTGKKPIEHLG